MHAVQATAFGSPSVLQLTELPDPTPGPGQITIDVTHSAVGLIDIFVRQGLYRDVPGMPQPPFVPGLEVAGTVRALGDGVSGLRVGERVVSMSAGGIGGYAEIYVAAAASVVSIEGYDIDPAVAVSVLPNSAMAHAALTDVAHLRGGERVLVHGALGGFAAAFPAMARHLGASRVVGTVRASKLDAARETAVPYDRIIDSAHLLSELGDERFDVIIDAVGGELRTASLDLLTPGGRMIVAGNASEAWDHQLDSNQLWLRSVTVSGFNSGAYLPTHPHLIRPALEAAREVVAASQGQISIEVLPFSAAITAHERMESRDVAGRIVLSPRG
ncbi:NADPH quinone reductase [Mycetocola tolaasinivorans]|uniref:NADPH quinone reductase n=1 Tax=Mycetocola tolaasinivorans TaxID=76635 RepID=A0A3L7AAL9_9MICO|nr:zinc-binding dehydrogenase [Mycetocola tolaasinivorans]RLP77516.1 NADPH quinone reductase [Mycetocola tolaasinivorans]